MTEAINDLEVAKILTLNSQCPRALFSLEQAFEKALKSLYCYHKMVHGNSGENEIEKELKKAFNHDIRSATFAMFDELLQREKEYINSAEGKVASLNEGENKKYFENLIATLKTANKGFEEKLATTKDALKDRTQSLQKFCKEVNNYHQTFCTYDKQIREKVDETVTKYGFRYGGKTQESLVAINYFTTFFPLSIQLSNFLLGMEGIARYPLGEYQYNNLELLRKTELKKCCEQLIEMINVYLAIIPELKKA